MRPTQKLPRLRLTLVLNLILLWTLLVAPSVLAKGGDEAQSSPITYLHYNVDITLKPDGNFIVREIQQIQFNGQFRTAFAEIPRNYTSDITNLQVWEEDIPYTWTNSASEEGTYAVDVETNSIFIEWRYRETSPGDVRTFMLQYEVVGGLWVYPDETILEWRAVPADRSGIPVLRSQVTINLPADVPADDLRYTAYGPEFTALSSRNQVAFITTESIPDGTRFQVQVGLPPGLVTAEIQPWQIAEDTAKLAYRLEALDVDLVIGKDGQVTVTEHHRVAVDSGALYGGYRNISLAYLDDIANISLFEGDQPFSLDQGACETYCFQAEKSKYLKTWIRYDKWERAVTIDERSAGQMNVTWDFPALVKGEATTIHLQYSALGAIQVNEDNQRLNWMTVFPGRDLPVESASVRIVLPAGISWEDVTVQGGEMRIKPDGSISLVHEGSIRPNKAWQISLTMPASATGAPQPKWQQTLLAAEAEARRVEIRLARQRLGAAIGGALILVVGLLATLLTWHTWGRDRPTEKAIEYLSHPPSNLPPGIVAYLVDEKPTPKGVLASLFHMANLGLVRIDLADQQLKLQCNWDEDLVKGQSIQTASDETIAVPDHLVTLFNTLRPAIPMEKTTSLSRITPEFQKALPAVYAEMAEEATRFFTELPSSARHRWVSIGQWLVLGGIAGALGTWFFFVPDLGNIALVPTAALVLVGLAFMLISRWMPKKTTAGSEEATRWQAFRQYLQNLKDYGGLVEAQQVLDDHFAYAVALDVEEIVLEQAEELGGVMPAWTYPTRLESVQEQHTGLGPLAGRNVVLEPQPDRGSVPRLLRMARDWSGKEQRETVARPVSDLGKSRLSLQGLSGELGRALTDASKSVGRILNTAVGGTEGNTPFKLIVKGTGKVAEMSWDATSATFDVIGDILNEASAGGGSGGHRGWSGSSSRSTRWSSSSSRRSSSGGFSGRSSSSRRSGGGGRRGFG